MTRKADAVFEGGGVKGIGLVGAVARAEEAGYQWVNLAGTSAGAIVAALLAAGYRAVELRDILLDLNFRSLLREGALDRIPLVGKLLSLLLCKGIYSGEAIERWVADLLARKGVHTFGDLVIPAFAADPRYRYRVQVIASDISRGRLLILPQAVADYGLEPDAFPVARAVRMSLSIPFFFEPVPVRYITPDARDEVSYVVDGGLLSNFPIWLFDEPGIPSWPTFGFRLVDPAMGRARRIGGPISLVAAVIATMLEAHDALALREENAVRTVEIPTLGVQTTDFDLTREQAQALYEAGYRAADRFFSRWDFGAYCRTYRAAAG